MGTLHQIITQIRKNYRCLIYSSLLGMVVYFLLQRQDNEDILFMRQLRESEAVKGQFNRNNYNLEYIFIKNITQFPFFGHWYDLKYEKEKIFTHNEGDVEVYINKLHRNNYIVNGEEGNSSLMFTFILKDGHYIDSFFRGNLSLVLPSNFSKEIEQAIEHRTNLTLNYSNILMSYYAGHYFDDYANNEYNNTTISITGIPSEKLFSYREQFEISSNFFSKMHVNIINKRTFFNLNFTAEMLSTDGYSTRIGNYSIILTIIAGVQIYYSTKLGIDVRDNTQVGGNLDLLTVVVQIVWDSLICSIHFFLAITNEKLTYEYGMPSIMFFILFSIFQLRIGFLSWKSRYTELFFQDQNLFRKKMCQFYTIFYLILFLSLISIRFWYDNFYLSYLVFLFTWLFQIYFSASSGIKPPMSYGYILIFTLSKLFIPCYLKACPHNGFELRPSYNKVMIIVITGVVEGVILSGQKGLGSKWFIPKCLKEEGYNYYKAGTEIDHGENECIICLDRLENATGIMVDSDKNDTKKEGNKCEKIVQNLIEGGKDNMNRKEYMATPCNHTFHTKCGEKWMEMKNECPYCRNKIPPLES